METGCCLGRADGCPGSVDALQKMLVMKQMMQVVVDDSIRWEAEALGADAVALAEAYSSASRQRAGAFGLAMDLRLGIWGSEPTMSKPKRG